MIRKSMVALLTAVGMACLLSTNASALVQGKCVVSKNKCMSKKADSLLKCHQKAETPGKPADPNAGDCVTKAKNKFDGTPDPTKGCFEKIESKLPNDCASFDDTAAAEMVVDDCVDDIVQGIDPGAITQTKCGVGKKKCVAKYLKSVLKCYEKAQKPGASMDPNFGGCLDKAADKYDGGVDPSKGCFVKLETKAGNDCGPPTGNQAALQAIVDGTDCVQTIVAILENTATTTTTTVVPTTTTTTTTTTLSTTTTTGILGNPTILDFTTGLPGGTCGNTRNASMVLIKNLTCGGLNLGSGGSIVPEGPTPDGSISRFSLACAGPACTLGATAVAPAVNTATPDCTTTGCNFGTPLPIPNPAISTITTCVLNTWSAPASGTLNLNTGVASTSVPLSSDVYITGNLAQPCPRCSATGSPGSPGTGTCDRGPRTALACTTTSSTGYTRDCPTGGANPPSQPCTPGGGICIDGSHVGVISVNLSPLTTGSSNATANGSGFFCPGQTSQGCFGSTACRFITENGAPTGPVFLGVPTNTTLASVFCLTATGNGIVDASAALPGPGAVSLPGTLTTN